MKLTTRITLSCLVLAAAALARAQTGTPGDPARAAIPTAAPSVPAAATSPAVPATTSATTTRYMPPGSLGHRFIEFTLGRSDIRNYPANFHELGFALNVPVKPGLDFSANLGHGWYNKRLSGIGNVFSASLTAFMKREGAKPFATGALGYQWWDVNGQDKWVWSGAAGVQVPVGRRLALVPRLSFSSDFHTGRRSTQQLGVETEANFWVAPTSNVFLSAGYTDVHRNRFDTWNARAGFRFAF